jgi:hypothetical protein
MGLTPMARSGLYIPPQPERERSELERLMDEPVPGEFPHPS